jgi:inosose dehydratase
MVRFGVSPIGWSNDDLPELGGATPLQTCLAETHDAGFTGIELGHKFPREAQTLRPVLAQYGLALVSGWYSGRLLDHSVEEELTAVGSHVDLLAAMGCEVLVYAETTGAVIGDRNRPLSSRPRLGDGDWPAFGARLTEFARHLARGGLGLAYHHHMGTVVESGAEIDRLMATTGDDVGLLLDTGHLAFASADPATVARRHGTRINHVHCKDVRSEVLTEVRARDASFLDAVIDGVFTVPGDGAIDFGAVMAALAKVSYGGWLVVEAEQDPAKAPPVAYARGGLAHLRSVAARAGIEETR